MRNSAERERVMRPKGLTTSTLPFARALDDLDSGPNRPRNKFLVIFTVSTRDEQTDIPLSIARFKPNYA